MAIEKALTPADFGVGTTVLEPSQDIIVSVEGEEGSNEPVEPTIEPGFPANLAEVMNEGDLTALASTLIELYDADEQSRKEWKTTYTKGLDLLGMKTEERTTPWPGACGVFHPLMNEAAVRFQSNAIMEIFPASGPCKTVVLGKSDPEKQKQAQRVKEEMNYLMTERMSGYRAEMERLLFNLPLAGMAFKKVYYDEARKVPAAMFVSAEDMVVPYGTTDLLSCERITEIMRRTKNELRKLQVGGFYKDVDIPTPAPLQSTIKEKRNKLSGEQPSYIADQRHMLLEMHVDIDLVGYEDRQVIGADEETGEEELGEPTGIALPYVVTIEYQSRTVLAIRRNWKEGDPSRLRIEHYVSYPYMPGFGFYGTGLITLIGGLTKSATSILRQLVDAGTLANLPGGLKTRGMRIKGDDTPIMPGEWRDVDIASGSLRDNVMPLPYKEPSAVLFQLLQGLVEEGRRLASISDLPVGDANAQSPVGTTLALLERAMKVMSAVQARLHAALRQEMQLIVAIVRDNMDEQYEYVTDDGHTRTEDFDDRVDVIPVSDPNAASMAQRIVKYQSALQLASQAPNIYNLPELHRQVLHEIGLKDVERIVPNPDDMKPMDPVSENMAILTGKPVKAFLAQDHESHIKVHMNAAMDPKIQALVGQSPQASLIQGAMSAHVAEHVGYQYRREIEKQMGVALPAPTEELPEDVEAQLSKLTADASDRVLKKDENEARAQKIQEELQDPVLQAQLKELEIKEAEVKRKTIKDIADIALEREKLKNKTNIDNQRIKLEGAYIMSEIAANAADSERERRAKTEQTAIQTAGNIEVAKIGARNRPPPSKKK